MPRYGDQGTAKDGRRLPILRLKCVGEGRGAGTVGWAQTRRFQHFSLTFLRGPPQGTMWPGPLRRHMANLGKYNTGRLHTANYPVVYRSGILGRTVLAPPRGPRTLERERCFGQIAHSRPTRGPLRAKWLVCLAQPPGECSAHAPLCYWPSYMECQVCGSVEDEL